MCGICGIALADREASVSRETIETMCATLAHRGPDDAGVYLAGPIGLGHRRLSIVDLAHGHQPMCNEDGSVWITFNGEVYNHATFRSRLEARGHVYATRCDTEAIVHLYEEQGERCPSEMEGMFAFAIWDSRRGILTLARDRTGIKPLYYALTPSGDLVFASEIKAIFASALVSAELDTGALGEYFATGHVSGGRTLYRDVRALAPGHVLTWRDGITRHCAYWSTPEWSEAGADDIRSMPDAADRFWHVFSRAVESTLMSDVPLGVFLSGGLDSSLIVAAMREGGVERLETFSVGFREAGANELPFARVAASAFGTNHREVVIGAREFFEAIPLLTWHRDHPLTFSASIPLYYVSRLARDHVKVVLTGEGSDELFAGYGRYPRALWNRRLARLLDRTLAAPVRGALAGAAARGGNGYVGSRIKRSFIARPGTFDAAYLEAFAEFDEIARRSLLGARGPSHSFGDLDSLIDPTLLRRNPLEAMLRYDQATYLEELLMKQDRMSMATSIESRVPFLENPVVEWAARLDPRFKLSGGVGKAVVRAAAARHLPRSIAEGQKRGFLVPLGEWLRGEARDWLAEYAPRDDDELLDARYVRTMIEEHRGGRDHTGRLWRILAFQVWRRDVLAHAARSPAVPPPVQARDVSRTAACSTT